MHFGGVAERHEKEQLRLQAVSLAGDLRVAQAMPALEALELTLDRHVAGAPVILALADVEIATARVGRHVVVAVAGEPPQLGVAKEAVTAGLMRNEAEEAFAAEVVDPRVRRLGRRDHVLAAVVVEMSELHCFTFSSSHAATHAS